MTPTVPMTTDQPDAGKALLCDVCISLILYVHMQQKSCTYVCSYMYLHMYVTTICTYMVHVYVYAYTYIYMYIQ